MWRKVFKRVRAPYAKRNWKRLRVKEKKVTKAVGKNRQRVLKNSSLNGNGAPIFVA